MITIVNVAIENRTDRVRGTMVLNGDTREELDRIIDLCEIVGTPEESLGGGFFIDIPLSAINRLLTTLGQQEDWIWTSSATRTATNARSSTTAS